jgi:hypothetical protein
MSYIPEKIKDTIVQELDYPSWEEYYNWVSRSGQFPSVTAQLIEAAMDDAAKLYAARQPQIMQKLTTSNEALQNELGEVAGSNNAAVFKGMGLLKENEQLKKQLEKFKLFINNHGYRICEDCDAVFNSAGRCPECSPLG